MIIKGELNSLNSSGKSAVISLNKVDYLYSLLQAYVPDDVSEFCSCKIYSPYVIYLCNSAEDYRFVIDFHSDVREFVKQTIATVLVENTSIPDISVKLLQHSDLAMCLKTKMSEVEISSFDYEISNLVYSYASLRGNKTVCFLDSINFLEEDTVKSSMLAICSIVRDLFEDMEESMSFSPSEFNAFILTNEQLLKCICKSITIYGNFPFNDAIGSSNNVPWDLIGLYPMGLLTENSMLTQQPRDLYPNAFSILETLETSIDITSYNTLLRRISMYSGSKIKNNDITKTIDSIVLGNLTKRALALREYVPNIFQYIIK